MGLRERDLNFLAGLVVQGEGLLDDPESSLSPKLFDGERERDPDDELMELDLLVACKV